jgi:hypothetical protein
MFKQNWKKYIVWGLVVVAIVWFAWSSGWFGGSPAPLPPLNETVTGG